MNNKRIWLIEEMAIVSGVIHDMIDNGEDAAGCLSAAATHIKLARAKIVEDEDYHKPEHQMAPDDPTGVA